MANSNPAAVVRILRHQDPHITADVYGHLAPGRLPSEVDRPQFGALQSSDERSTTPNVERDEFLQVSIDCFAHCSKFEPLTTAPEAILLLRSLFGYAFGSLRFKVPAHRGQQVEPRALHDHGNERGDCFVRGVAESERR